MKSNEFVGTAEEVANELVDASEEFCRETIYKSKIKLSEASELLAELVVLATLLYSVSRRLEIEFPYAWKRHGQEWLEDVQQEIKDLYPLLEIEYGQVIEENNVEVENRVATMMDETYSSPDANSMNTKRVVVECAFLWMQFRLYENVAREEIEDVCLAYVSMSNSLYETVKSIMGV